MPVKAAANPNYHNATEVSQKYNPLKDVVYKSTDQALYSAMLTNRWHVLKALNVLPQPLNLVMPSWDNAIEAEKGNKPPLVVVSSNRSGWIAKGIAAAKDQLKALKIDNFDNVRDLRALQAVDGHSVSPPIYCPKRLGPAPRRNVYIVVHTSEYETYKAALAGSGITPVGWQFKVPLRHGEYGHPLAGFGVTRFAAIQFCKELGLDKAWVVDDNTVAFENFPGLAKAEAGMLEVDYAVGFTGADHAQTRDQDLTWANAKHGHTTKTGKGVVFGGILQQVVLWNIAHLTTDRLNFPPAYMASAEDLSLSNYLKVSNKRYRIFKSIKVRKEVTSYDNNLGATAVQQARQAYEAAFANAESRAPGNAAPPPPPFKILNNGNVTTVQAFIDAKVLQDGPWSKKKKAACQAVEEITKRAIWRKKGVSFVSDDALTKTFHINGNNAQVVLRSDVP